MEIRNDFPHGPEPEETESALPISDELKAEIGDCRMAHRNAYGTVIEPSRLILEALIRYRHDLGHLAAAKRDFDMAGIQGEGE